MSDEENIRWLIKQEVDRRFKEKDSVIHQSDILPKTIKRGHVFDKVIVFGTLAKRPADDSTGVSVYFATDNDTLYLWNGTAWVSELFT